MDWQTAETTLLAYPTNTGMNPCDGVKMRIGEEKMEDTNSDY